VRAAEGKGIDVQQRAAFGSALVTGHFVLQSAASATASDPAGRAPLYLSALSNPLATARQNGPWLAGQTPVRLQVTAV
jgi:hypothetical protein